MLKTYADFASVIEAFDEYVDDCNFCLVLVENKAAIYEGDRREFTLNILKNKADTKSLIDLYVKTEAKFDVIYFGDASRDKYNFYAVFKTGYIHFGERRV